MTWIRYSDYRGRFAIGGWTLAGGILCLVLAVLSAAGWPKPILAIAGAALTVSGLGSLAVAWSDRSVARDMAGGSNTTTNLRSTPRVAGPGDPSAVPLVSVDGLPDVRWTPEGLQDESNAFGAAPPRILFLWMFDYAVNLRMQIIAHGWAHIGPVHLLLSPTARTREAIVKTEQDLAIVVARLSEHAGRYSPPMLSSLDGGFHSYVGFPINAIRCADSSWQFAFAGLLKRCSLFVVDMTGSGRVSGLESELRSLMKTAPKDCIVLLVDKGRADVEGARRIVADAWSDTQPAPRNGVGDEPPPIFVYDSRSPGYLWRGFASALTGRPLVPIARRVLGFLADH